MSRSSKKIISVFLVFALVISILSGLTTIEASAAVDTNPEPYNWDTLAIGGGGYVTGIAIHPKNPDLIYIRTDVGGAYRWDPAFKRWIPITDMFGTDEMNYYGVDSIALDPNHENVVYMTVGKYPNETAEDWGWTPKGTPGCELLKSTDYGRTWQKTGFTKSTAANGAQRWAGESIAVDPANSDIVYIGTRVDGLWRTTNATSDGQISFEQIPETEIPLSTEGIKDGRFIEYNSAAGARMVVFDKNTAINSVTQTIYVGIVGKGIYRTTDAGQSWSHMEGSPDSPQRMSVAKDGALYIASFTGLFKFKNDTWTNISPNAGEMYGSVDVDPTNPEHVVAGQSDSHNNLKIYRTVNGGTSWTELTGNAIKHQSVPWYGGYNFASATSQIIFNPSKPKEVWFTTWYDTWVTYDITAVQTEWYTYEEGHEEMVAFTAACPPAVDGLDKSAHILTAIADNDGNRHTNITAYPLVNYNGPDMQETTGIDFCEADPNIIARVGSWFWGEYGSGGYSQDNGQHWTEFETYPSKDGKKLANGKIAVSATRSAQGVPVLVTLPINSKPYYSEDLGKTWIESSGAPTGAVSGFWDTDHPIAADRVDGNVFYLYYMGKFYNSTDGGKNWSQVNSNLPNKGSYNVKAAPGKAGEVWVSLDDAGVYRSTDYGVTFNKVEDFSRTRMVAFGKNADNSAYATVFVYGTAGGKEGIYRSTDLGQNWVKINDDNNKLGNDPRCMEGDRQTFGLVYIGTNGRGFYYGAPANVDFKAPKIAVDQSDETVREAVYTVSGAVNEAAQVVINGEAVSLNTDNSFSKQLTLNPGPNTITIDATDNAGNPAVQKTLNVVYDPNAVIITLDQRDETVNKTTYTVSGKLNTECSVTVAGIPVVLDNDLKFSQQVSLEEGANTITVEAVDLKGNLKEKTITVTRDSTAPVLTVDNTGIGTVNQVRYSITGRTSERATVKVNGITAALNPDNSFSVMLTLKPGDNAIRVEAYDAMFNTAAPAEFNINCDAAVGDQGTTTAKRALTAPTIDGRITESNWKLSSTVTKDTTGASDNTATFGTLWDKDYLYVAVNVEDSKLCKGTQTIYLNDSIEVYVDGNGHKSNRYEGDDRQIIIGYDENGFFCGQNKTGIIAKPFTTDTGYSAEVAIPWSNLGVNPADGYTLGLDVGFNDDDDNNGREAVMMWNGTNDNWQNTSGFGACVLSNDFAAPSEGFTNSRKTLEPVAIDGNLNETGWKIDNSVIKAIEGEANNTAKFGTMWDDSYYYVGVKVDDENLYADSTDPWQDDSVEIYIDANNGKTTTYQGDDRQIIVNFDGSKVVCSQNITGIIAKAVPTSEHSYEVEVAIPWTNLGITPKDAYQIGLDIGINDDDNGGNRESVLMWNGTGNNWGNTSAFGTGTLVTAELPAAEADITLDQQDGTVYSPDYTISGSVGNNASVTINGKSVPLTDGLKFSTGITLNAGQNSITVQSTDAGGNKFEKILKVVYAKVHGVDILPVAAGVVEKNFKPGDKVHYWFTVLNQGDSTGMGAWNKLPASTWASTDGTFNDENYADWVDEPGVTMEPGQKITIVTDLCTAPAIDFTFRVDLDPFKVWETGKDGQNYATTEVDRTNNNVLFHISSSLVESFTLDGQVGETVIDPVTNTINLTVAGITLRNLTPTIKLSSAASTISPESGVPVSFASPVNYTVTTVNGDSDNWRVKVTCDSVPGFDLIPVDAGVVEQNFKVGDNVHLWYTVTNRGTETGHGSWCKFQADMEVSNDGGNEFNFVTCIVKQFPSVAEALIGPGESKTFVSTETYKVTKEGFLLKVKFDTWEQFGPNTGDSGTKVEGPADNATAEERAPYRANNELIVEIPDKTAPVIMLNQTSGAVVTNSQYTVSGSISEAASISVNGTVAAANATAFEKVVTLNSGLNAITVQATDAAGNSSSAVLNVTYNPETNQPPTNNEPPTDNQPPVNNQPASTSQTAAASSEINEKDIVVRPDGTAEIKQQAVYDAVTKEAKAVISEKSMTKVIEAAKKDSEGKKAVVLEIKEVKDAATYTQELPCSMLSADSSDLEITLKTPAGTISVPENMLNNIQTNENDKLTISVRIADRAALDKETAAMIGDRPVYEINAAINGKPVVWNNPDAPVVISVDYKPTAEELKNPDHIVVWYIDGKGNIISVPTGKYDPVTGKVTFKTTHFSKYAVAFANRSFLDISKAWVKNQIEVLASKGIIDWKPDSAFKPSESITRGEFIAMLVRALGLSSKFSANFNDVETDNSFYTEIGVAKALGITSGTGNNRFSPDRSISRQDMMILTAKALKIAGRTPAQGTINDLKHFTDLTQVSKYAVNDVAALVKDGIITGSQGKINPRSAASKAEAAAVIYTIFKKY